MFAPKPLSLHSSHTAIPFSAHTHTDLPTDTHNSLRLPHQNMPGEPTVPLQQYSGGHQSAQHQPVPLLESWDPPAPSHPTRFPRAHWQSQRQEHPASTLPAPVPREAREIPKRDFPPLVLGGLQTRWWLQAHQSQPRQGKPMAGPLPGHGGGTKPCSEPGKERFQAGPRCPAASTHTQAVILAWAKHSCLSTFIARDKALVLEELNANAAKLCPFLRVPPGLVLAAPRSAGLGGCPPTLTFLLGSCCGKRGVLLAAGR